MIFEPFSFVPPGYDANHWATVKANKTLTHPCYANTPSYSEPIPILKVPFLSPNGFFGGGKVFQRGPGNKVDFIHTQSLSAPC